MLYDILIIDDDFSGETVLDEMQLESQTSNNSAWEQTIMPFYFGLIRENLKVIWTTGETDDLKKLDKYQLAKIKYIICDLHLLGINLNTINKTIISKIMGIMNKLNTHFNEEEINFLVNSKYIVRHKNIANDLQEAFNKKYPENYSVAAFNKKNAITNNQKQTLLNASLLSHIKEQIIAKHLEVERCLNQKIDTKDNEVLKALAFSNKHKIVKKSHNLNGYNKKIDKLNESRNAIAHTPINSLNDLKNIQNFHPTINKFIDLIAYIEEINALIKHIANAKSKST